MRPWRVLLLLAVAVWATEAFIMTPVRPSSMSRMAKWRRHSTEPGNEEDGGQEWLPPPPPPAPKSNKPVRVERITKGDKLYVVEQWADGGISFREEPLKQATPVAAEQQSPPKPRGASRFAPPPSSFDGPSSPPPPTQRRAPEPPIRVNRPPGLFEVENRAATPRMEEDRQVMQALTLFGNEKGMLFGSIALALGSVFFYGAWQSGALDNSPSRAYMNEEAVEYMLKNDGMGLNYDRSRMDITVRFEDGSTPPVMLTEDDVDV